MKYVGLPPGNILQYIFLSKRLEQLRKKGLNDFVEMGSGKGHNSKLFLDAGFKGNGFDLNEVACQKNEELNKLDIIDHKYKVINEDFFKYDSEEKVDIVFSCMVIEHMPDDVLKTFFEKAKQMIVPNGRIICMVPSSMKHWGIEDEIAGHVKRYESEDVDQISKRHDLKIERVVGLTYPMSNWLLKLSNKIVSNNESDMLNKSQSERTVYTGNREVEFKTTFPRIFNLILNSFVMYPFHLLQMSFKRNPRALVMYFELTKKLDS